MTPKDYRLGGPLPRQQPNLPQPHPKAEMLQFAYHLNKSALQPQLSIADYPQFPEVIHFLRVD